MPIGVDIEDIERFKSRPKKFLDRIFTDGEQVYCDKKPNPESHYAVRFCAKESVFKALSQLGIKQFSLKEIEIFHDFKGCPQVRVNNEACKNLTFEVSLSHDKTKAIEFVTVK